MQRLSARALLLAFVLLSTVDYRAARAQKPADSAQAAGAQARVAHPALARAVEELARWAEQRGGRALVAVLDVRTGRELAAKHAGVAANPASNAKVFTAAAALAELGPGYRYTTELHGRLHDGAVTDLVLRGHGDPSLTLADLSSMCRSLVAMGLRRVDGRILVDQSRFDGEFWPPAYAQQPDEWAAFRAPVSAVALERNTVTMNVVARDSGQPATVWFHPPGFVSVSGTVRSRDAGSGQAVRLSLTPEKGRLRAKVGGHLAAGLPRLRFARRVDDPRLLPGHVLAHLLQSMGVTIKGGVARGGAKVSARLVWHRSEPLSGLLDELGKRSDNFYAEMILKTLGAEQKGKPATSAAGAAVVLAWLKRVGAADAGTVVVNGSGLFDANRASPRTLVRALAAAWNDPALRPEFVSQLAVGGVDGTLRSRFRRHAASRRVRGKTGTLARVDALSGYVLSKADAAPAAFAIIVTGISRHWQVRRRVDQVVEQIARLSAG